MKNIMKKAWEIARKAAQRFGGKAAQYIAGALRMAWKEARKMSQDITERIDELSKMGFNRWQKNGMDRMYINASTLGLECIYRKSGSISYATFQGYEISHSEGGRLKMAKTYIDLVKKQIVSDSAMLAAAAADLIGAEYKYGEKIIAL